MRARFPLLYLPRRRRLHLVQSLLDTQKSIDTLVPPEPAEPMPVDVPNDTTPDASQS